ncbi:MAG: hypothetical protein ACRDJY_01755 [Thermoleophilaceae bacterium]
MATPRVTSVMVFRATALVLLLFVIVPAVPAAAEETRAQKLFRNRLLNDREVSADVKRVLRNGGFVDRDIRFGDLTGDGKSDALVLVNQGGSSGRIAVYVFSSHKPRNNDGGGGDELRIRYKAQRLYRARASLKADSSQRPRGAVVYRTPVYDPGDQLNDPGATRVTEVRWRARRSRFGVEDRRVVDHVRKRFCSSTGDYCTETIESTRGVVYLELRSISFNGRYTLCVTPPAGSIECRFFTLRRNGDRYISHVRWKANFPDGGVGRYRVVWRLGPDQLGPALGFRRS